MNNDKRFQLEDRNGVIEAHHGSLIDARLHAKILKKRSHRTMWLKIYDTTAGGYLLVETW